VKYRLEYKRSVKKELQRLPKGARVAIVRKILALAGEPKPEGSAKLKGSRNLYRFRHGDYRVVYSIDNDVIVVTIIRIGHRREVYRQLAA
jgi:mRNA interferase RelE/StbE